MALSCLRALWQARVVFALALVFVPIVAGARFAASRARFFPVVLLAGPAHHLLRPNFSTEVAHERATCPNDP